MKCTEFKNLLDDYCDNELSDELKARCDSHLSSCLVCTDLLKAQNQLVAGLKAMPVIGSSEGFTDRVIRVAMETSQASQNQGHEHHRRGFMVGFGSAAVAALALWFVVGIYPQHSGSLPGSESGMNTKLAETTSEREIPEFSIALNQQHDIKLAFYSADELKGAQITLQMPENVAVVGFPGQKELAWKTNLARGNNMLRLPVIATGVDGGQLVAKIEYMGKVRMLKVKLAVGSAGVSGRTDGVLQTV